MLNPVFSVKHLREMTPLFYNVIHRVRRSSISTMAVYITHAPSVRRVQTRDAIMKRVRAGPKDGIELDMVSWSGRTTLEVLGQAGLGHSFDPLTADQPDEFATAVQEFLWVPFAFALYCRWTMHSRSHAFLTPSPQFSCSPQLVRSVIFRVLLPHVSKFGPASFRRWVVERTPMDYVQSLRRITDIMHDRSVQIFNEKKALLVQGDDALKHQIGEGRDIMSILREFLAPLQARSLRILIDTAFVSPGEHVCLGKRQASGRRAHRADLVSLVLSDPSRAIP